MNDTIFSRDLEWEATDYPLLIENPISKNGYYRIPPNSRIKVWRNNHYKLAGKIEGTTTDHKAFDYREPGRDLKDGHVIKGDTFVTERNKMDQSYQFFDCYVANTNYQLVRDGEFTTAFDGILNFKSFAETSSSQDFFKINRWYLSGKINAVFPRSTERTYQNSHTKFRHGIDIQTEKLDHNRARGFSRDFFLIDSGGVKCIVQKAHRQFLPDWANGICIEFRKDFGIPDDETQIAVAELIGFILGTQLLDIGFTEYNDKDQVIGKFANDPWGDNVVSKCGKVALPPVRFPKITETDKVEIVINEVLPTFLKLRKPLGLSDLLWKYWVARDLAIGTNLPILSSALENLAEQYLKHNQLLKKFSDTEKDAYATLIKDELSTLETKLKDFPLKESVMGKLRNPFQTGVTEKLRMFFSSLGFSFDKKSIENKALRSRNIMTHGNIEVSDESIPQTIKLTRAYETLFHRSLLKVISYTGKYIDYSAYGHPERSLSENMNE